MDTTNPKPFVCITENKCDVNFSNSNHLTVDKQQITLNIGVTNKSNGAFIADQTPTPTRLIRNCEEVGLFDDLKHVNPFEETFRRAVESKNECKSVEVVSVSEDLNQSENSLHTPQVFPQYETASNATNTAPICESSDSSFNVEREKIVLTDNICSKQRKPPRKYKQTKRTDSKTNITTKPLNILPAPANSINQIILPVAVNLVAATPYLTISVPETTGKKHPILLPKSATTPTNNASPQPLQQMSVKEKLKAQLTSPKIKSPSILFSNNGIAEKRLINKVPSKNVKRTLQDTQEEQMARRRAAALRYRTKMKKETNDLKRRNSELAAENKQLKETVFKLKELLNAHQQSNLSIAGSRTPPSSGSSRVIPAFQIPVLTPVHLFVRSESIPLKINQCLAGTEL